MKLFTKKSKIKKERRFNPHLFWIYCLSIFVMIVIGELIYFSLYFLNVNSRLDSDISPNLETNEGKIKQLERTLDRVEQSVKERTGETSQNSTTVVE